MYLAAVRPQKKPQKHILSLTVLQTKSDWN